VPRVISMAATRVGLRLNELSDGRAAKPILPGAPRGCGASRLITDQEDPLMTHKKMIRATLVTSAIVGFATLAASTFPPRAPTTAEAPIPLASREAKTVVLDPSTGRIVSVAAGAPAHLR
jgi:hypothetical protein